MGTRKIAISRMLGRSLLLRPSLSLLALTRTQTQAFFIVRFHPTEESRPPPALRLYRAATLSRTPAGGGSVVALIIDFTMIQGTPSDSRGPAPGFNTSRPVHGSPRWYLSGPTTVIFFPRRSAARKRSFEMAKSPPAGCSNQRRTISFFSLSIAPLPSSLFESLPAELIPALQRNGCIIYAWNF